LRELDASTVSTQSQAAPQQFVPQQAAPQQAAPQQAAPQQAAPQQQTAPTGYDAPAPAYGGPAYGAAPQAPQAYPGFAGQ